MARAGSIIAGGAFPLNEEWRPLLANLCKPSKALGRILDPFANKGDTIEYLGDAWNLQPHAVELQEEYARVAQEKFGLTKAICGDAYETTISSLSFSVVYLNPPYDDDPYGGEDRRAEYRALRTFWAQLQMNGLMIFVVYSHNVTKSIAKSFLKNCSRTDIYRFPDLHLGTYTQIAIVGKRHADKRVPDDAYILNNIDKFVDLCKNNPQKIRDISLGAPVPKNAPEGYDPRYEIPATRQVRYFMFESRKLDIQTMLKLNNAYGAHLNPKSLAVVDPPREAELIQPIAPPRDGQLVVVLAAGLLDGAKLKHEGVRMLVRGKVERVEETIKEEVSEDSNGYQKKTEVIQNRPQPNIVVLNEDGKIDYIDTDEKIVDFIGVHGAELMRQFKEIYKPAYDLNIIDLWGNNYDRLKVKGESDLLDTQEQVATAGTEHILRNESLIIVGEPSTGKTIMATSIIANMKTAEQMKASNPAALDDYLNRYPGTRLKDIRGIKPGEVVIVLCPGNIPSKWVAEIEMAYPEAVARQLKDARQARLFFEEAEREGQNGSERVYIGIVTYEDAKLSESWKPAFHVQNKHEKIYETIDGTRKRVIKTTPRFLDPVTGEPLKIRVGGETVFIPESKMTGKRQYFYTGPVFNGYEEKTLADGDKRLVPSYKEVTERHGRAMFSVERIFGLPKVGNGRADFDIEEIDVRGKPILRKVFKRALTPEPVLDEWISMSGIRCMETKGRKTPIEKYMKKAKLTKYTVGGGHPALDKLLRDMGTNSYEANQGYMVYRNPRYPVADYIAKKFSKQLALVIVDEVHRAKSKNADQANAMRALCYRAKKCIGMTGTLYGGVASSIYVLEFVFNRKIRSMYPWMDGDPIHWISRMGVLEDVFENKAGYSNGHYSGHKRVQTVSAREAPGCSPELVALLLDHCVFVGLKDLGGVLPDFTEQPTEVNMDPVMRANYEFALTELKSYNTTCMMNGDGSFVGAMFQSMLRLPDSMHRPNEVWHRTNVDRDARKAEYTVKHVMTIPDVGDYIKPKEQLLIDKIAEYVNDGRRVIVHLSQTGEKRDIRDRIVKIIADNVPAAKPFMLNNTVQSDARMSYIQKKVDAGFNVMVSSPKLVAEGVDLVQFSRTIYIEVEHSLMVMGQSSRRTWRINQKSKDVKVEYIYYDDVYQKAAVMTVAQKTAAADVIYGNEGGSLSALSEGVKIYEVMARLIKDNVDMSQGAIADSFNKAAYTADDYMKSSWYAPPRKNKAAANKDSWNETLYEDDNESLYDDETLYDDESEIPIQMNLLEEAETMFNW